MGSTKSTSQSVISVLTLTPVTIRPYVSYRNIDRNPSTFVPSRATSQQSYSSIVQPHAFALQTTSSAHKLCKNKFTGRELKRLDGSCPDHQHLRNHLFLGDDIHEVAERVLLIIGLICVSASASYFHSSPSSSVGCRMLSIRLHSRPSPVSSVDRLLDLLQYPITRCRQKERPRNLNTGSTL